MLEMFETEAIDNKTRHSLGEVRENRFQGITVVRDIRGSEKDDGETNYLRSIDRPENFLLDTPTQDHVPH